MSTSRISDTILEREIFPNGIKKTNAAEIFTADQLGAMNLLPTEVLAAAAVGQIDLNAFAHELLANQGLNKFGVWVGVNNAIKAFNRQH